MPNIILLVSKKDDLREESTIEFNIRRSRNVLQMFDQTRELEEEETEERPKGWLFFNVTNYKSLMYHCILLNKCMGFLRFEIKSSKYVSSKSYCSSTGVLMVIFVICLLLSLYIINFTDFGDASVILHTNFIFFLSPMIVLWGYVSNNSTIRMIEKVEYVARLLPPKTFRKMARTIFIKDTFRSVPFIFCLVITLETTELVVGITCWYVFLSMVVVNSLYANNVTVLNACFKRINDSLVKLNETVVKEEPHLLRRVYQSQKNSALLMQLRTLKKQHLEISEVLRLINETYGVQNLGTLSLLFIDVTFNVYHYVALFTKYRNIGILFSTLNLFIIYYLISLFMTVWITETTKDQAQKVGSNIHRIVVNTFDEQMTIELELFSLQVLQSERTFSTVGLPIDATILSKLVGSVTTYVLILVQFLLVTPC